MSNLVSVIELFSLMFHVGWSGQDQVRFTASPTIHQMYGRSKGMIGQSHFFDGWRN